MLKELTGRNIRGYQLQELIGKGGSGAVYRALQTSIDREVALKIIHPEYANQPEFVRRFEAEARLVARLEHLHIVSLYDYWRDPSGAYLVLRWLRGGNLRDSLNERGAWSLAATYQFFTQIASALMMAHRNHVIHRDIKPANILFDDDKNAYLSDFGIALRRLEEVPETVADGMFSDSDSRESEFAGSARYISPEQINLEVVTPRSDIYSFSILLYEMLMGTHPYPDAKTSISLFIKHLGEPLPQMHGIPASVEAVIFKGAEKNPEDRYSNVREMMDDFRQAMSELSPEMLAKSRSDYSETSIDLSQLVVEDIPNPYKGLNAFYEGDADDFFGRENLIKRLLKRLNETHPLSSFLAVVGPSGSGKSSVVRAGLIPALRAGELHGSEDWFIVEMLPGREPMRELEDSLVRISRQPVEKLRERLWASEKALSQIVEEILPPGETEVVLVVDQFEEVFTLTDEPQRLYFLRSLYEAVVSPEARLRLIITLRADFYDRPLMVPGFSRLIQQRTEVIVPLSARELAQAIIEPARRVNVYFERGLAASILSEVREESGVLPMLQYALTELFAEREGRLITAATYQELGGVSGALARRAEEIYSNLDDDGQKNTREMFLRLVTPGEGVEDTRRRALIRELVSAAPLPGMGDIIDLFGKHRLLTFDRDPVTREPTVEVAHEALIRGWWRFREWMDAGREDVRLQRLLSVQALEWDASGRDDGLLLRGSRLIQLEEWAEQQAIGLTELDTTYLTASITERLRIDREEEYRLQHERELERRARQRLQVIVVILAIATIGGVLLSLGIFQQSVIAGIARDDARQQAGTAVQAQAIAQANLEQVSTEQARTNIQLTRVSEAQAIARGNLELAQDEAERAALAEADALAAADARATAQVNAQNEANRANLEVTNVSEARATAQANLLLAQTARADSENSAADARNAQATAQANFEFALTSEAEANTNFLLAQTAQAEALDAEALAQNEAQISQSFALAASADRLVEQDSPLALALAIEANRIENPSLQAQRTLLSVAFDAPRRRFDDVNQVATALFFLPEVAITDSLSANTVLIADAAGQMHLRNVITGEIMRTFRGHSDRINSIDMSNDGRYILTASDDNTVILWRFEDAELLSRGVEHTAAVNDARFNATGARVVSGADDATVRTWDVINEDLIFRRTLPAVSANAVNSVAYRPGTQDIVVASEDALRYWDADLSRYEDFAELANRTQDVAFSPDGELLLAGGSSGVPELWDIFSLQKVRTLPAHLGPVNDVAFSPDGRLALSASDDFAAILSNVSTGAEVQRYAGHSNRVNAVAFSSDGRYVLSGGTDRLLYLWDVAPGTQIERRFNGLESSISYLKMLPDAWIFAATDAGSIALWQEQATNPVFNQLLYQPRLPAMAYDLRLMPDDTWLLLSGSADIRLHRLTPNFEAGSLSSERLQLMQLTENQAWVQAVVLSADGRVAVTGGGYFFRERQAEFTRLGLLKLWDTTTGELIREFDVIDEVALTDTEGEEVSVIPEGTNSSVTSLALHPDGLRLVSGFEDGRIILWNIQTGERLREFSGHTDIVTSLLFTDDGAELLSGSADRAAILWRVGDGELLRRFTGHTDTVNDLAFSPDENRNTIVTASEDRTLRLWDTDTGELIQRLGVQDVPVTQVLFTGDASAALIGTLDGGVFIDNIDTAANLLQWVADNRYVPDLTCSQREQFRVQPLCASSVSQRNP